MFTPHKLVVGILLSHRELLDDVRTALNSEFGELDYESPLLPFTYTAYYREEMGDSILRGFLGFRDLVDPEHLAEIKILTNEIEARFTKSAKRTVNLDPGLLCLSRFILATTKDNAHRIALKKGIYAELTLLYTKKDFQVLPWTYPDFTTREYRDILLSLREEYKENLKHPTVSPRSF